MSNPWGRAEIDVDRTALLALSAEPQSSAEIASKTGLPEAQIGEALHRLTKGHVAIADEGKYELTGPLSWFGDFAAAIAHFGRKRFLASAADDPASHLFLCDIRVKGSLPPGDPRNESVAIFACGKTASELRPQSGRPTCEDCAAAASY